MQKTYVEIEEEYMNCIWVETKTYLLYMIMIEYKGVIRIIYMCDECMNVTFVVGMICIKYLV